MLIIAKVTRQTAFKIREVIKRYFLCRMLITLKEIRDPIRVEYFNKYYILPIRFPKNTSDANIPKTSSSMDKSFLISSVAAGTVP